MLKDFLAAGAFEDQADFIINYSQLIDPTPEKSNVVTLLTWIMQGWPDRPQHERRAAWAELLPEDLPTISDDLKEYNDLKRRNVIPKGASERNIQNFLSANALSDYINAHRVEKRRISEAEKKLRDGTYLGRKGHAEVIWASKSLRLVRLYSAEAAKAYGKASRWCTARDAFPSYQNDLLYLEDLNVGNRYQISFENGQWHDERDRSFDLAEMVAKNSGLGAALKPYFIGALLRLEYELEKFPSFQRDMKTTAASDDARWAFESLGSRATKLIQLARNTNDLCDEFVNGFPALIVEKAFAMRDYGTANYMRSLASSKPAWREKFSQDIINYGMERAFGGLMGGNVRHVVLNLASIYQVPEWRDSLDEKFVIRAARRYLKSTNRYDLKTNAQITRMLLAVPKWGAAIDANEDSRSLVAKTVQSLSVETARPIIQMIRHRRFLMPNLYEGMSEFIESMPTAGRPTFSAKHPEARPPI